MVTLKTETRPLMREELDLLTRFVSVTRAHRRLRAQRFECQERGEGVYLAAWNGITPVGHVLIKWGGASNEPVASELTDCPEIEDLLVVPNLRSNGIGTLMLRHVETLSSKIGYRRIGLAVGRENPRARALYERLGYEDAGFGDYIVRYPIVDRVGFDQTREEVCMYMVKWLK